MSNSNVYVESILPTKVSINSTNSVAVSVAHRITPVVIIATEPEEPTVQAIVSVIQPGQPVLVSTENTRNGVNVQVVQGNVNAVKIQVSGSGPIGPTGPQGLPGAAADTFESISKNLKAFPASFNYTGENLTSIVYDIGSGTITKSFAYTGENLTSITLSGNTPAGINLTKSFAYTGENLTSITYN